MAYMVIDTETAPTVDYGDNKPHPETSLVYDLGGVIIDNGKIVDEFSFTIAEVFYNDSLMKSAYYASKLPQYHTGITRGEWLTVPFQYAYNYVRKLIKKYKIRDVWAYNAKFDRTTLNFTTKTLSNSWQNYFFPYKVKVKDVWAKCTNITGTKKYVNYCIDNGYITDKGNPLTNAEVVYRFITDDMSFDERHTALDDSKIENAILTIAKNKHAKSDVKKGIYYGGWRPAQKVMQSL